MHCLSQPVANERLKYNQQKIESNKIGKKLSIFFSPFVRIIIFCAAFVSKMIDQIFFEHLVSQLTTYSLMLQQENLSIVLTAKGTVGMGGS
jgi:hypothetical protein